MTKSRMPKSKNCQTKMAESKMADSKMAESKMAKLRMAVYKFFLKLIFGDKINLRHKLINLGQTLIFYQVFFIKIKQFKTHSTIKKKP